MSVACSGTISLFVSASVSVPVESKPMVVVTLESALAHIESVMVLPFNLSQSRLSESFCLIPSLLLELSSFKIRDFVPNLYIEELIV